MQFNAFSAESRDVRRVAWKLQHGSANLWTERFFFAMAGDTKKEWLPVAGLGRKQIWNSFSPVKLKREIE